MSPASIMRTPDFPTHAPAPRPAEADAARRGVFYGLAAYCTWGSFPAFFKALHGATPLEIVCHRVAWSFAFLLLLLTLRHQLGAAVSALRSRANLFTLCGSTLLIGTNWLVFIYAVQRGEVLQSSLGYFITPLISILLGRLFLGERLSRWQQGSVLFALAGVATLALRLGAFPWIALTLAVTFGLYGLLRKLARVEAMVGLTVETLLLTPLAVAWLLFLAARGEAAFLAGSLRLDLLLPLSGVITALPLISFVAAARRLRLATVGFLQYITPSLHFLLAVGLYDELFTAAHLASFALIWAGLALYSADAVRCSWRPA